MSRFSVLGVLLFSISTFSPRLGAQESRGNINGSVVDAQGASVARARIEVRNVDTGVVTATTTNIAGLFSVEFLMPGNYSVTADAPGFKKLIRTGLILSVAGRLQVDLQMEVGAVSDTVTVSGGSPLLETTNASIGRLVEQREITDMPVAQSNPINLANLAPGVMNENLSNTTGVTGNGGNSEYRTMGGMGYNEYTLDGLPITATVGQPGFTPNAEMVDEIKLQTTTFDAQNGFSAGVVMNLSSKGGTNKYHGAIFDEMYQQRWNATPFFTRLAWKNNIKTGAISPDTPEQASGRQNIFGVTVGGPVRIPKVYDGHDKLFFFFSYNGFRSFALGSANSATGLNYNVPQAPWWNGDFSALQKVNPTLYTVYDPRSTSLAAGRVTRTPFPNNMIPQSQISDPMVKFYQKVYPTANNVPGIATAEGFNDYFATGQPAILTFNSYLNRYDYNINANHRVFAKWYWNRQDADTGDWTYQSYRGLASSASVRAGTGGDASYVWIVSHSTVLTAGAGITRYMNGSTNALQKSILPSQVGLPSYMDAAAGNLHVLPSILFSSLQSVNVQYPSVTGATTDSLNFDLVSAKGRHNFKYGWNERRYHYAAPPTGYTSGAFTFNNSFVKQADNTTTASNWGLEFASFLLGVPSAITYTKPSSPYWSSPMRALYFQDDWRVSRRWNINLGLRYERQGGITERYNRGISGNFDFSAKLPYSSAVEAAYAANPIPEVPASQFKVLGGINYLGQPDKTFTDGTHHFLPRIGAAWQIRSDTVLRLGYGWFDDVLNVLDTIQSNQFGFSQNTTTVPSNDNGLTFCCGGLTSTNNPMLNPFPNGFLQPYGNSLGASALSGQSFTYWPRDYSPARQQRWRAGLQHQFGKDIVAEVAYEGSYAWIPQTFAGDTNQPINYVPQQYYCTGAVRNVTCDNNLTQNVPNPYYIGNLSAVRQSDPALYNYLATQSTFSSPTIAKARLLQSFPQYTGLSGVRPGNTFAQAEGRAIFRDVTFELRKRYSYGFTSSFVYTRSSGAVQDYYLNPFDPSPSWEASNRAPANRLVWSAVWDLPAGKGKKWLTHGPLEKIVGGWQLGWLYEYQTGFWVDPYITGALRYWNSVFFYGDTKDLGKLMNHSGAQAQNTLEWFDPSIAYKGSGPIPAGFQGFDGRAADQPGTYQARTFPRTITALPVDGPRDWDLRIQKTFNVGERTRIRFAGDAFNLTNHTQFGGPDLIPTDAAFGFVSVQRNVPRYIEFMLRIEF